MLRFLLTLSLVFISVFGLKAQFEDHPILKYLGQAMNTEESRALRKRGLKEGFNIKWHTRNGVVEEIHFVVVPGKPSRYEKRYKAYKGEIPYCPKIKKNKHGEIWAVILTCPPSDAKKRKIKNRDDIQFQTGNYVFRSKRNGYFAVCVQMPFGTMEKKKAENRGEYSRKAFEDPDFDPSKSLVASFEELKTLCPPTGNDVWKVAGSGDGILRRYYMDININTNKYSGRKVSAHQYDQKHWAEWDILETNDPEGLKAENVTGYAKISSACEAYLTDEHGVILAYNQYPAEFPIAIPKDKKLSSAMAALHADPKVKSIQFFNHPKRHIRITAEVETDYGPRFLDFYQSGEQKDYYRKCVVHNIRPPLYGDISFWIPILPGDAPWDLPFIAYSGWANKTPSERAYELCSLYADVYEEGLRKMPDNKIERIAAGLIKTSEGWKDYSGKNISEKLDKFGLTRGQFKKGFNCPSGLFIVIHVTDNPEGSKLDFEVADPAMVLPLPGTSAGNLTLTPYTMRCAEKELIGIWAVTNKNSENNYLRIIKVRSLLD